MKSIWHSVINTSVVNVTAGSGIRHIFLSFFRFILLNAANARSFTVNKVLYLVCRTALCVKHTLLLIQVLGIKTFCHGTYISYFEFSNLKMSHMAYKYTLIQFLLMLLLIPMLPLVCFRTETFIYLFLPLKTRCVGVFCLFC
jgi:hypothetical protein